MNRIIVIFVLMVCHVASAITTNNAATASRTDVNAAIALCSAGDYVIVPAGTVSWSGGVTLNGVNLIGPGKDSGSPLNVTAGLVTITKHASQYTRMIGVRFTGTDQHFAIGGNLNDKAYIVGDCYFSNDGATLGSLTVNGGLFYSCAFNAVNAHSADVFACNLGGIGSIGQTSWTNGPSMGTNDTTGEVNNYFEDCTYTNFLEVVLDNDNGSRSVFRHCMFVDSSIVCHGGGTDTSGNDTSNYGNKHLEVYNCTFKRVSNANAINKWVWWRGGGGVFASNAVDEAGSPDGSSYPNKVELSLTVGCPGAYPLAYQVGQVWTSPTNPPAQPLLIIGNTGAGSISANFITVGENPNNACATPSTYIVAERDYVTTNTWNWRPFTYPHPLAGTNSQGGGTAAAYFPPSPRNKFGF